MDIETLITIIFTVLFLIIGATRKKKEAPIVVDSTDNTNIELHFGSPGQSKETKSNLVKPGKAIVKEQVKYPKHQMKSMKKEIIVNSPLEWEDNSVKTDYKSLIDFDLRKAVIFSEILKPKYF